MTQKQKLIVANLTVADTFLRTAMVLAAQEKMILVTNDIRESEWNLDDAIAHVESYGCRCSKKKLQKALDKLR